MASSNKHLQSGFTLIEALISIAIISILSTVGVTNMNSFQQDSKLESFASEFSSNLESARNKSVNSEIPSGYVLDDFDADTLPHWVVDIGSNKYSLYAKFKLSDGTDAIGQTEDTQFVAANSISPTGVVDFERLSGYTTPVCFTLQNAGYSKETKVYIDSKGNVSRTCP